ncbi:glycosyltransferase family 9 protein [Mesonia sp. K7]|uniref:glycosyltransferase family 9 protein n=1 Tax=Mesonia sp. K7 TaxID=2218606 RepID=UPI000DA84B5B|nr:glycosyltransferase family 9 protein [Mesonia sp. K7]PZD78238.1 lipopolysaccharide heptosyltransferase family protein [Mesonia sp. K7]
MKILVIQQKMIGDVLTTSLLFEVLRSNFPSAELHYLVNKNTIPVLENNPFIDQLIMVTPEMEKSKKLSFQLLKQVRQEKYDIVIDVYSKLFSGFLTYFSGAKTRIGLHKSYTKLFYSHTVKTSKTNTYGLPMAFYNRLEFLQHSGLDIDYAVSPKIYIHESEKEKLIEKLSHQGINILKGDYLMVNCLGSGKDKTYPLKYMAEILDAVVVNHPDKKFFLNYIPNQIEEIEELKSYCTANTKKQILDFYAPSLREFIVLTSFCQAVFGNEGGAINMGKALGIKTFAIFSPWIRPTSWMHQNNDFHQYAHLNLYCPERFNPFDKKELKAEVEKHYGDFTPNLFKEKLVQFLN